MPGELLSGAANVALAVGQGLWDDYRTRKMIDYKYDKQKALIEDQRNYDSPAEQMKRLREAGLNPDLIYGQLSAGQQPAAVETDQVPRSDLVGAAGQGIRLAQQQELLNSQLDLNASQAEKNRAEAESTAARGSYYRGLESLLPTKEKLMESNININDQRLINMQQEISESVQRIKQSTAMTDWINSRKVEQDIYNQHAEEDIMANINLKLSQIGLNDAQKAKVVQATQHAAAEFKYTIRMLANEAELSDASMQSAMAKLGEQVYRSLELQGLIKYNDKTGQWELTEQGEKTKGVDSTLNKIGQLIEFVTRNVSRLYGHRTFSNLTGSDDVDNYQEEVDFISNDKGYHKSTSRTSSHSHRGQ